MNHGPSQAQRAIAVTTPLDDDVLLLRHMTATEELGRLFDYRLDLLSEDEQIKLEDVLGQPMTVRLALPNGETRHFNGFVSRFAQLGRTSEYVTYEAVLKPWLWFLTRTTNCRIFQNLSVPDIIKKVFRERGFNDFDESLSSSYRTWEYCVQYRETDFNFVSRLMEQEGIYYYFKHEEDKHTLILSDAISAHERIPGYEEIPYYPPTVGNVQDQEHVFDWYISQQIQPGTCVLEDFDFERPRADLKVKLSTVREHAAADFEIYDYPGEYREASDGEAYVKARFEEVQSQFERVRGSANTSGLTVGGLFELTEYPREDQNREYLVISAVHQLESDAFETGTAVTGPTYTTEFEAIFSHQAFRSARITPKPIVQGPQTAIVVGKAGEEIWTDEHGRVKVQFHWDREGRHDENSSCWIRVSQVHAGAGFGGIDIPRIGEEAIIEFLEGDPDRPIITGRVYNGDNKAPTGLPAAGMVSGLKSNSTPGGGGYNEMTMDDTKGKEKIAIHGQFNMDTTVENDQSNTVNNNRTTNVAVDDSETVGSNQTINIGVDQTVDIGSSQSISIGSMCTETIGIAKALSIGAGYQVSVGAGMNESVGGAKAEEIGGAKIVGVGGVSSENVGVNKSVNAGGKISESAGGNFSAKAGGSFSSSAGGKMSLSSGGDFSASSKANGSIDAASTLVLKCGGASITLSSGGEITIKGTDITIKGSGKIGATAGGDVVIKGSTVKAN